MVLSPEVCHRTGWLAKSPTDNCPKLLESFGRDIWLSQGEMLDQPVVVYDCGAQSLYKDIIDILLAVLNRLRKPQ